MERAMPGDEQQVADNSMPTYEQEPLSGRIGFQDLNLSSQHQQRNTSIGESSYRRNRNFSLNQGLHGNDLLAIDTMSSLVPQSGMTLPSSSFTFDRNFGRQHHIGISNHNSCDPISIYSRPKATGPIAPENRRKRFRRWQQQTSFGNSDTSPCQNGNKEDTAKKSPPSSSSFTVKDYSMPQQQKQQRRPKSNEVKTNKTLPTAKSSSAPSYQNLWSKPTSDGSYPSSHNVMMSRRATQKERLTRHVISNKAPILDPPDQSLQKSEHGDEQSDT